MRRALWRCAVLCGAVLAWAMPASGAELDQAAREVARMNEEVLKLFAQRDYAKGEALCRKLVFAAPDEPTPHYNLACALARLGRTAEALAALEMAVLKGFDGAEHMGQDDDLASLRNEPRFARCVEKAKENARNNVPEYEAGAEIKGLKTVEGAPEGGLRYRLRLSPSATKEKPDRLIVWLHPAGGSMNQVVEPLAERFAKLGYALLVLTQKDWRFWSPQDATKLVKVTLPEAAKTAGLDAERPVLMGYSAGGQAALELWHATPGAFGGLVLDAAYPLRPRPDGKGFDPLPLPDHPAARRTPVFVIVGEKDGGAQVWRMVEPAWRQAGVPLTVRYVPDKGHTWLLGPKELDDLAAWLEQLKAGNPPATPEAPRGKQETK